MPSSLTLTAFSDRDLLYTLEEVADAEGWATAKEVADEINIDHPRPTQCVGARFAWLKRFKIMEFKIEDGESKWKLNATGESLLHSKEMTKPVREALANLTEGQRVAVTELIAKQIASDSRKAGRPAGHMSRRAWKHSMGTWRDPSLTPQKAKA